MDIDEELVNILLSGNENCYNTDYNNGEKHQQYLLYQLSQQVNKQLVELKKLAAKQSETPTEALISMNARLPIFRHITFPLIAVPLFIQTVFIFG